MADFSDYCAAVCTRVRSRPDRPAIAAELTAHLEDHADFLHAQGADTAEAERQAVEAMGDPVEVGKALDRLHPPVWNRLTRLCHVLLYLSVMALVVFYAYRFSRFNDAELVQPWVDLRSPAEVLDLKNQIWGADLVGTGTVTGGGRMGDYFFAPGGNATVSYVPAYETDYGSVAAYYCVHFPVRVSHWQPWLSGPSLYNADYTFDPWADSAYLDDFSAGDTRFSDWYMGGLYGSVRPDEVTTLTVLAGDESVTFTVEWEGAA